MGIHYIESTPLIPVSTVKPSDSSDALDACGPPGPCGLVSGYPALTHLNRKHSSEYLKPESCACEWEH